MASFDFSPEESMEAVPTITSVAFDRPAELPHLDQMKRQIVENNLRALESNRLQQHSFMAIAEYLKEANEIDYQTFLTLRDMAPQNSKQYFSAKIFMYLQPDRSGYISSEALIRYIHKSMGIENLIFKLLAYSARNDDIGWITSDQLQLFVQKEFIHIIDPRNNMDVSFYEFYTCTAVAKFLFYLDQRNINKIPIRTLVHSDVMDELQTLAQLQTYQDEYLDTEFLSKIESNWFHVENVLNVYHSFLQLDVDQNGLLSLDEIAQFRGFSMHPLQFTEKAVRRIAEELIVFAPFELDYRGYVKLVIALDDLTNNVDDMSKTTGSTNGGNEESGGGGSASRSPPRHMPGLRFFWQVVDYDRSGVLSPVKIKYFLDDVIPEMSRIGQYGEGETPIDHTVVGEIYDMIGYNGPIDMHDSSSGPSFDEIVGSRQGDVILLMLLDVNSFYRYENRENFMHQGGGHQEDDDQDQASSSLSSSTSNAQSSSGSTAGHTPRPTSSDEAKKKFDFATVKYDDEDEYEDDYEF